MNKPTYIDEKYVEATNSGWIDNRTGEILVAIPLLLDRLNKIGIEEISTIIEEKPTPPKKRGRKLKKEQ